MIVRIVRMGFRTASSGMVVMGHGDRLESVRQVIVSLAPRLLNCYVSAPNIGGFQLE